MKTKTAEAIAKGLKAAFWAVVSFFIGKKGYDTWKAGRNSKA